jgi:hypothetical protein
MLGGQGREEGDRLEKIGIYIVGSDGSDGSEG